MGTGIIDEYELMQIIKSHLVLKIEDGGFTDANRREVKILWSRGKKEILLASASFDVTQKPEYEG